MKRGGSLEAVQEKRKESGGCDKKRGKSLEVVTRKEGVVWRLGQEKRKESGGCDKKRGKSLDAET
jgi:hypothetical protein